MIAAGLFMPKVKPKESFASSTDDGASSTNWIVYSSITLTSAIPASAPN